MRVPTIESLVVGALVLFGFRAQVAGIADNSTYVHLRTGIEMVRHSRIPRADPYSFTAFGHPWVVQSWFASLVYGLAYVHLGPHVLLLLNGALGACLAWVVARLARTGSAVRTMATASIAVLGGAIYWAPRPLMFGLLALGLLITVVERRASFWWLLPIGWLWVNTHGSFPLGAAWLGARAVGEALDVKRWPRWLNRYLLAFVAALGLGAVNPLGPRLLAFPLAIQSKQAVFRNVVEWRSPDFQSNTGLGSLAFIGLVLLILLRARLSWSDVVPVVGFLALGLLSVRNMSGAAVVVAPALGRALHVGDHRAADNQAEPIATPAVTRPPPVNAIIASGMVLIGGLFLLNSSRGPTFELKGYPTQAEDFMARAGLLDPALHRVAAQDIVGCYLILIRGTTGRVFIDDRVDMYPVNVSNSYDELLHGAPDSIDILNRAKVDVVLWDRRQALVGLLHNAGGWRQVYPAPAPSPSGPPDRRWVVLERDPSVVPGTTA